MARKIALFGGSFNPPGVHHRQVARELAKVFDTVMVVPCGPRPDKAGSAEIDPLYRAAMVELLFRRLPKVRVDLFDLENLTFTRTYDLYNRFRKEGEVWLVIGADLIKGGKQQTSPIQREWYMGEELWKSCRFAVLPRKGVDLQPKDLPPKAMVLDREFTGSSSEIRERVFKHQPVNGLLTPEVTSYVERYGLYLGRLPRKTTHFSIENLRTFVVADKKSPKALQLAKRFKDLSQGAQANLIVVIGGDGILLHAIRKHWRLRIPFFGINAGHRGFLLNEPDEVQDPEFSRNLILRQLPLLYVEAVSARGETKSTLGFNDAWVERRTGQSAWLEVRENGQIRIPKLIADGVLLASAAGSTAYARAMGATPILVDTAALLLVGSNVMEPTGWTSAHLPMDSEVEFRALDPAKRPIVGFVDGIPQGEVVSMRVRVSRTAAVELAFVPSHDIARKLAEIQFPK